MKFVIIFASFAFLAVVCAQQTTKTTSKPTPAKPNGKPTGASKAKQVEVAGKSSARPPPSRPAGASGGPNG